MAWQEKSFLVNYLGDREKKWGLHDDGHFDIFAVSLLVFHFNFLLFFVYGVQFSDPNNTMLRRKRKYRRIVSNGAEFFRAIFV